MPPHRPSILLSRLKALVMPSTQKSVRARLSQPGTGKWTWTPLIKSIRAAATWTSNFIDPSSRRGPEGHGTRCLRPTLWSFWRSVFSLSTLATVVSIVPRLSFWGGYERLQGLCTTAAYGVVFLAIVSFLRTPEQAERLLSTALVVSVPVSLYGIIQHFGTDPVPWSGDVTQRVASTMGNPIFVAAFLSLIVPLTLYRHLEAGRRISSGESRGMQAILSMGSLLYLLFQVVAWCLGPTTGTLAALTSFGVWILEAVLLGKPVLPFIRIGSYSILLSTQLACILLSQSRGPWLGLLASLMFFVLFWLLTQRKWRGMLLLSGGGLAIVLLLVVVNLPDAPLAFVRTLPYVGRLGQIFESSGQVRLLIWQGATRLVVAQPVRMLIGYGPEAMHVAYPPYYPPDLGHFEQRTALPDRAHNEIFDVLVTTGCLGLVVFLSFFTSLVLWGLQSLDLLRSPPQRWLFLALWSSGGVVAVLLACWLEHSWRLFGVALPFGMLTGLFVYLGVQGVLGFRRGRPGRDEVLTAPAPLLGSAVLAAIIGHFVEIQFGIAIAATRTYFWALVALLVVSQSVYLHNTATVTDTAPSLPPTASTHQARQSVEDSDDPSSRPRPGLPLSRRAAATLVGSSPVVCWWGWSYDHGVWIFVLSYSSCQPAECRVVVYLYLAPRWQHHAHRDLGAGAHQAVLYPSPERLWHIHRNHRWQRAAVYGSTPGPLWPVTEVANIPVPYYAALLLMLLAIGGALLVADRLPVRLSHGAGGLVTAGLALGILCLVSPVQFKVIRADVYYKQAVFNAQRQGQYDRAVALMQRAVALQPQQDFYYLFLGKTLLEQAVRVPQTQERQRLFAEAQMALTGQRSAPFKS